MRGASSFYFPDEPISDYVPEYSAPVELEALPPDIDDDLMFLALLPSVKLIEVMMEPHPPAALRSVYNPAIRRQEHEEQVVIDSAWRLKILLKMIRAEWPEERIAVVRPFLGDLGNTIRLLMKPDARVRKFNPMQPQLFDR